MDRSNKIAQAYGYAVCFIAVVSNILLVLIAFGWCATHRRWLRRESQAT